MICKFGATIQDAYNDNETPNTIDCSNPNIYRQLEKQIEDNMNFYSMGLITYLDITNASVETARKVLDEWMQKKQNKISGGFKTKAKGKRKTKRKRKGKKGSKRTNKNKK